MHPSGILSVPHFLYPLSVSRTHAAAVQIWSGARTMSTCSDDVSLTRAFLHARCCTRVVTPLQLCKCSQRGRTNILRSCCLAQVGEGEANARQRCTHSCETAWRMTWDSHTRAFPLVLTPCPAYTPCTASTTCRTLARVALLCWRTALPGPRVARARMVRWKQTAGVLLNSCSTPWLSDTHCFRKIFRNYTRNYIVSQTPVRPTAIHANCASL